MPEVRQLSCPNCGAPLQIQDAAHIKTAVCQSCGSQIDLTDPALGILGQFVHGFAPPRTPIRPGMYGQFDERYQVLGRIRYRDEEVWDEWLMMTAEGRFKWLSEGKTGFSLWEPFWPRNPIDVLRIGDYDAVYGQPLNLEGFEARITDRGVARIEFIEGEMSWRARAGDRMNYLEAEWPNGRYSIEWTEEEVEFFKGQRLDDNTVRAAFGLPPVTPPRRRGRHPALVGLMVLGVVVLCCLCLGFIALGSAEEEVTTNPEGTPLPQPTHVSGGQIGPIFVPIPSGSRSSGSGGGGSIRTGSPGGSRGGGSSGGGGGK